jgi:hypothetical protein
MFCVRPKIKKIGLHYSRAAWDCCRDFGDKIMKLKFVEMSSTCYEYDSFSLLEFTFHIILELKSSQCSNKQNKNKQKKIYIYDMKMVFFLVDRILGFQ